MIESYNCRLDSIEQAQVSLMEISDLLAQQADLSVKEQKKNAKKIRRNSSLYLESIIGTPQKLTKSRRRKENMTFERENLVLSPGSESKEKSHI